MWNAVSIVSINISPLFLVVWISNFNFFRFNQYAEKAKARRQAERQLLEAEEEKEKDVEDGDINETTVLYVPEKDGVDGHVRVSSAFLNEQYI